MKVMKRYGTALCVWFCLNAGVQAAPARMGSGDDPQALASINGIVDRDDGIPPLLGIAAQSRPHDDTGMVQSDLLATERLRRQVQVQKKRIAELSRTIATLNMQQVSTDSLRPLEVVAQLTRERDALRAQEAKVQASLKTLQQSLELVTGEDTLKAGRIRELTGQLNALQERLDSQQSQLKNMAEQEKGMAQLRGELADSQEKLTKLQQAQKTGQESHNQAMTQLQATLKESEKALQAMTRERDADQQELARVTAVKGPVKPEGKAAVRDYAIGTSLAKDVLALLSERESDGVMVDKAQALAGIEDAFAGKFRLSDSVIETALAASEKEVVQAQTTRRAQTEKTGQAWMKDFARRKGVKKHPEGFLYLVEYAGKEAIADTDTVAIVVKESLTDGSVINDMDQSGALVSLPLNAYPALFQSAIRLLKSHGSITLVVPPALAYGDRGYPPKVPPGATIIYNLRIHDVMKAQGRG